MACFRYKTPLVVGPWRKTLRDAMFDAVRNGFASWAGPPYDRINWRFPGEIEEGEEAGL